MKISVLTVFDQLYTSFLTTSLIGRAQKNGLIDITVASFMQFADANERIDRPTCGPSAGMLIAPGVVERAVDLYQERFGPAFKIFFSPQGKKCDQEMLSQIYARFKASGKEHMMLFAARYEGMDARVEQEYADVLISVGDFVLMGGDLPAMVFMEGFLRLLPGVVGDTNSVAQDSFQGPFVDYPEYCLPVEWKGRSVPEVLRSGNHGAIAEWRHAQAARSTVFSHFSWLKGSHLSNVQKKLAHRYIPPHYVVLMHSEVLVGPECQLGTTSVTSLDIHDIARSARTYGLRSFFIVTPLLDQQKIVKQLLSFWKAGHGIEYNPSRHEAVRTVEVCSSIQEVIDQIEKIEGKKPLCLATSARYQAYDDRVVSFSDQEKIWSAERPVLIVLGTGRGLSDDLIARVDFTLLPVHGFSDYNHLSVRSAAAIIFDRWLGISERHANFSLAE